MKYKLYTIDNEFIEETNTIPDNFTGITETYNGDKYWFLNGEYHRIDGPAIEWHDETKYWYSHGNLHKINGPAVEYADGTKEWFIYSEKISEEQRKLLVGIMKLKGLL